MFTHKHPRHTYTAVNNNKEALSFKIFDQQNTHSRLMLVRQKVGNTRIDGRDLIKII